MKGHETLFSSGKDDWQTPLELFQQQHALWNFTVDGAANDVNHLLPAWWGYHDDKLIDALTLDWGGERVWLNPPYSMCKQFIEKAYMEMLLHNALTVALVPARTDTKWFHSYVYKQKGVTFDLLKGRLKFRDNSLLLRETGLIERLCLHGIGHPVGHTLRNWNDYDGVHGCDGCCHTEEYKPRKRKRSLLESAPFPSMLVLFDPRNV